MITLLNIDCMEYMATVPDKYFDLAIVDPPYGLGNKLTAGGTWSVKWQDKGSEWDNAPTKDYFIELQRISKKWIIFGGNYFIEHLPNCRHFISWHKPYMDGMHSMSNVELALTNFDMNAKSISINKDNGGLERLHVCQKPVALYKWLLKNYATPEMKIFDSHGGSFSSAIACYDFGTVEYVGCELDPDYYAKAVERFERHKSQINMFRGE